MLLDDQDNGMLTAGVMVGVNCLTVPTGTVIVALSKEIVPEKPDTVI